MGCFNIGAPTISHHIKELANANLITTEKRGKFLICKVNKQLTLEVSRLLALPPYV
jgi:ArsR family transcriptional regulator, arsenate/arsenite/antimonite-responsive transcriptional repressor